MKATKKAVKNPDELLKLGFKKKFAKVYKKDRDGAFITIDLEDRRVDIFLGVPSAEKIEFIQETMKRLKDEGLAEPS